MNILPIIEEFTEKIGLGNIEIYNEDSVQYELAIFLRQRLDASYKVQLERNVNYFDLENKDNEPFKKRELDIVIFDLVRKKSIVLS